MTATVNNSPPWFPPLQINHADNDICGYSCLSVIGFPTLTKKKDFSKKTRPVQQTLNRQWNSFRFIRYNKHTRQTYICVYVPLPLSVNKPKRIKSSHSLSPCLWPSTQSRSNCESTFSPKRANLGECKLECCTRVWDGTSTVVRGGKSLGMKLSLSLSWFPLLSLFFLFLRWGSPYVTISWGLQHMHLFTHVGGSPNIWHTNTWTYLGFSYPKKTSAEILRLHSSQRPCGRRPTSPISV